MISPHTQVLQSLTASHHFILIWPEWLYKCNTTHCTISEEVTHRWYLYSDAISDVTAMGYFMCWCHNHGLSATLHRLISASISRWMTFDLAKLPILRGGKCCALSLLNIIPKFPKEKNKSFCQIYHKNPAYLCVPFVWLLRDTMCVFFCFKLFQSKVVYVTNRHQKDEQWQRLILGDCLSAWCCT